MRSEKQMATAAAEFAERWKGRGYERGESQPFWIDLLTNVFGIETPSDGFISFEDHRMVDASNFIDGRIPSTRVLIEQKSLGKDLRKGILQSDGSLLNPFQQARRYVVSLPVSEHPRWIVTCNFSEFLVYDMEQPNGEPEQIMLENLGKEYYRLQFLVDAKSEHLSKEMQVSMQAGEIVGKIYDALLRQYDDNSPEALRWLNILCVRIVFCLYAEDAGVFTHDQFHDFLVTYEAKDLRRALRDLFEVLNTPLDKRSKYLQDDLKAFPYTNGGLFDEEIEIPQFTDELRTALLQNASLDFDWSEISPTIFGAVFESTLNPETRRSGGMHYTSIENIHKVIDPLFLNDLRRELNGILEEKIEKQRQKKLDAYQDRLASLTFLDPACGSGNFLTETYLSLRRLENEVIRERHHGQSFIGFEEVNPIKVSIQQFYGIEINDFAVTVATTALWISEAQMLAETEKIIRRDIDFLPLKSYTNIREGNALRMDWNFIPYKDDLPSPLPVNCLPSSRTVPGYIPVEVGRKEIRPNVYEILYEEKPKEKGLTIFYNYIMGNPPFVGARQMNSEQKADVISIFGEKWKNVGNLDYVCCWYMKAFQSTRIGHPQIAFVSTNSICQGEQVANLWQPLMENGLRINFAHRTFRWDSEASMKAHVHCVIVGFSATTPKAEHTYSPSKIRGGQGALTETEHVMNTEDMKSLRRMLRKNGTPAEGGLWNILKGKKVGGLQFRRQFSIGPHIVDFYCPALKLAVELDGDYHYYGSMPEHDQARDDELLHKYGIRTLRFENKMVFQQPEAIVNSILQMKEEVNAPHPPLILEGELNSSASPVIYDGERIIPASHINAYLMDAPDVFISSRPSPICDVPWIGIGNKPIDGGNYLFTKEQMEDFIKLEPLSAQYFKPWYGSEEFIHQRPRYCLWLGDCSPAELRKMPHCLKRIEAVREIRLASTSAGTRKLADRPTRFHVENMPDTNYIIVPSVSSEKRRYVPMGFMYPDVLASNLVFLIPNATLFHFGILESNVHMAWMRAVCGRLEMRYRYSKDVVYNNFPWPNPTDVQKAKIEQTAQAILDARALYPDSSLADLYDELTMPVELRKAHQDNDRAVMQAYGFNVKSMTESQCVAALFELYNTYTR
ncbi:MAG: DUF559 domain-containing protein [Prevotella sp.]|nr:DUF559 domain-containing protein [Prevotella sp.]